jgi:hypothetical protein
MCSAPRTQWRNAEVEMMGSIEGLDASRLRVTAFFSAGAWERRAASCVARALVVCLPLMRRIECERFAVRCAVYIRAQAKLLHDNQQPDAPHKSTDPR